MRTYLGTWQTSPSDGFWTDQNIPDSKAVISAAVRLGIRGFDTARSYGKGRAEQTLSKVLRRFTDIPFSVDTKIMPSAKNPSEILQASLSRLAPLKVDCLYLHWPKSGFDNLSFLHRMEALKESGKIRKLGVCNIPLDMLKSFVSSGLHIDRIQRPVSLLWTRELGETMEFCRANGIGVAAYSPTGMGLLSGKYRSPEDLRDARAGLFCFHEKCIGAYHDLLDLIQETARNNGAECTDVTLSWVKAQNPDIVLLGARNVGQLEQNLSSRLELTKRELSDLSAAAALLDKAGRDVCDNIFSYRW